MYTTTYDYDNGGKLNKVTLPEGKIVTYTHDTNGNIETVNDGGKNIKYYYNELNELLREDNEVLAKTIVYSYDTGGNILSKTEYPYTTGTAGTALKTYSYTYGDTNWKDKLTAFDDKAITYDAIGNPISYDGYEYTWEEGRQLKSITKDNLNMSFKYNSDGIRTEKNVNGVITKYHLVGDKVTFESNGTDSIYYTYENSNNLVSMNLNGTEYYYVRNGQGDITGLLDGSGNQVVSYTYDSWGKIESISGTKADTVGAANPYRYRGYRYDIDTGLYYLQRRYYNPEWGRLINADALVGQIGTILSHNIFAYCSNNPINFNDKSGFQSSYIWEKGIGGLPIDGELSNIGRGLLYVAKGIYYASAAVVGAVGARICKSLHRSKTKSNKTKKSRNKPKEHGEPNSTEVVRDSNGEVQKYTEFDENGDFSKEVRKTGKEHGKIPRPNVKEPVYNVNPETGEKYLNGYTVREATQEEIIKWDVK